MKRKLLAVSALAALTIFGSSVSSQAFAKTPRAENQRSCHEQGPPQMNFERHVERMSKELKLSASQKEQIKGILKNEKARMAENFKQMKDLRSKMHEACAAETFDEAAVKALADKHAVMISEQMVARAKTHHQINSILTPEQRKLAKKKIADRGEHGEKRMPKHHRSHQMPPAED